MTKRNRRLVCSKLVVVLGLTSAVMFTGCKGIQRRIQRRYSKPPRSFYDHTATAPTTPAPTATQRPAPQQPASQQAPLTPPVSLTPAPAPTAGEGSSSVYRLREGDPVVVYLRGIHGVAGGEQVIENIVSERGQIQLPYISSVSVGGKTATEAQDAIHKAYIEQQIYRQLTVNVVIPARSYYIRGEVRQPGRYPMVGSLTILQAVVTAGGYTEFANRRNAEILRGERRIPVNMNVIERNPKRDLPIEPGDVIIVNRSMF